MFTSDQQIIKLLDILIADGKVSGSAQFFEESGIKKTLFSKVKNQAKYTQAYHFSPAQIEAVCKTYNINFNFIFATSTEVYNNKPMNKAKTVNKIL